MGRWGGGVVRRCGNRMVGRPVNRIVIRVRVGKLCSVEVGLLLLLCSKVTDKRIHRVKRKRDEEAS